MVANNLMPVKSPSFSFWNVIEDITRFPKTCFSGLVVQYDSR